jgi:hypothetical protein
VAGLTPGPAGHGSCGWVPTYVLVELPRSVASRYTAGSATDYFVNWTMFAGRIHVTLRPEASFVWRSESLGDAWPTRVSATVAVFSCQELTTLLLSCESV